MRFSIVFQRGGDKVYNADKFMKQFGEFVYQNSCHLRHFGWQLLVFFNTVTPGLLVISFFRSCILKHFVRSLSILFAWCWTINFDVLIAYARIKNDWFGSRMVAVRKTWSRQARAPENSLNLEKCLNGAFWMDSKNYWIRIKCLSDRVTLSVR